MKGKPETKKEVKNMCNNELIKKLEYDIYKLVNERKHLKNVELNNAINTADDDYFKEITNYIDDINTNIFVITETIKQIKGVK